MRVSLQSTSNSGDRGGGTRTNEQDTAGAGREDREAEPGIAGGPVRITADQDDGDLRRDAGNSGR